MASAVNAAWVGAPGTTSVAASSSSATSGSRSRRRDDGDERALEDIDMVDGDRASENVELMVGGGVLPGGPGLLNSDHAVEYLCCLE